MDLKTYYSREAVQHRLAEYCGFNPPFHPYFSSSYLVGYGAGLIPFVGRPYQSFSVDSFHQILGEGLDIFRSILDEEYSLFIFDLEYFNKSDPSFVYHHPDLVFGRLESLYQFFKNLLRQFGIEPLTVMTGQGYHFVFQVQRGTHPFNLLCGLGKLPVELPERYQGANSGKRVVAADLAYGFEGMGRLQEFLAHILLAHQDQFECPLFLSDISPEQGRFGEEGISLDLTAFADPLFMRDIRLPFSSHSKGPHILFSIPRGERSLDEMLTIRTNPFLSAKLAESESALIPVVYQGLLNLIQAYHHHPLSHFHGSWDLENPDPPERWNETYLAYSPEKMGEKHPPCLVNILQHPFPHLLEPTRLHLLCRALIHEGWHPRHIGGLVRAFYHTADIVKDSWELYDPSSRADFWVRLFSGFILSGLDNYNDMNCHSLQSRRLCPKPWCGTDLAPTYFPPGSVESRT